VDTTQLQMNYFTDGVGGHETVLHLGFDASADFHNYTIVWAVGSIQWYVDGVLIHVETGIAGRCRLCRERSSPTSGPASASTAGSVRSPTRAR